MDEERQAAIDLDELGERTLSDLSAADFLAALNAGGVSAQQFRVWPEKKKVELWTEPENFGRIRLRDFVVGLREKKKVELEKDMRPEFNIPKRAGDEVMRDPRDILRDPEFIGQLADVVANQLRFRR